MSPRTALYTAGRVWYDLALAAGFSASWHDVTSTFAAHERIPTASSEVDETLRLCATSRSNVLLIGPDDEVERAIASITGLPSAALMVWSPSADHRGLPAESDVAVTRAEWAAVIVRDVQTLDRTAQEQLNDWLASRSGAIRTIATAAAPLHPLVERREFLESLYYRLNVVCIASLW